jgi:hypothetical protein
MPPSHVTSIDKSKVGRLDRFPGGYVIGVIERGYTRCGAIPSDKSSLDLHLPTHNDRH